MAPLSSCLLTPHSPHTPGETLTVSLPQTVHRNVTCNATDPAMMCPLGTRPCDVALDRVCLTQPRVMVPRPSDGTSIGITTVFLDAGSGGNITAAAGQASFNPLSFGADSMMYFGASGAARRVVFPPSCGTSTATSENCPVCYDLVKVSDQPSKQLVDRPISHEK